MQDLKMNKLGRTIIMSFLLLAGLFALSAQPAQASHYRYANLSWKPIKTVAGVPTGTVEFSFRFAARGDYYTASGQAVGTGGSLPAVGSVITVNETFSFGDNTSTALTLKIIANSAAENWFLGEMVKSAASPTPVQHAYAGVGPYTAGFNNCCRVDLNNGSGGNQFNLIAQSLVSPRSGNSSPVSTMLPILTVQSGPAVAFQVSASDPDGDTLRYRFATANESGVAPPANMSINSSGQVTWNTSNLNKTRGYAAQFIVEDLTINGDVKSRIPVDVLLYISSQSGLAPEVEIHTQMAGQPQHGPITVPYGTPVTFDVVGSDSDAGATVTINTSGLPQGGSMTPALPKSGASPVKSDFSWTPTQSQIGTHIISFSAVDNVGLQGLGSMTVQVIDKAVIANDDSYTLDVNQASALSVPAPGVLQNDVDEDNRVLTAVKITNPSNGSVTLNANGSFTYTPNAGFTGTDSFRYRANNGISNSNFATVTINVVRINRAPVASDSNVATNEGTTAHIHLSATDPDGDTLTYIAVTQPTNGTLTQGAHGWDYKPNSSWAGSDSFTFKANDGNLDSNTATVFITVNEVPSLIVDTPQDVTANDGLTSLREAISYANAKAGDDTITFSSLFNAAQTINLTGALPNLSTNITITGPGANLLTVTGIGSNFTILTVNGATAAVSGLTVSNGYAGIHNIGGTLTVTNCAANNSIYGIFGQGPTTVTNCIANNNWIGLETDNTMTAINCQLNGNNHGIINYNTLVAENCITSGNINSNWGIRNWFGSTATVKDCTLSGATYGVLNYGTVNVTGSTITNNFYEGMYSLAGDVTVANCTIADNGSPGIATYNPLTVTNCTILRNVRYGIYHDPNSGTATVKNSIVVDNTWGNLDGSFTDNSNNITSGSATDAGLDPADLQDNGGPTQTIALVNANGTAVNAGDNAAAAGLDFDQRGTGFPRKIGSKVDIGAYESNFVNIAPVADDQNVATNEDTATNITLTATDADNDALTYEVVSGPSNGTLSGAGANLTYTPNANYNGPDSFNFKANDGTEDSNVAKVSITVNAVNDAPTADNGTLDVTEDTPANGTLAGGDIDGDALTYSIVTNGTKGSAVITDPATGAYTYTPDANANGGDSFTFKVNDGTEDSNIATVSITVNPVNDAPWVGPLRGVSTDEDTAKDIMLIAGDADNDPLTYIIVDAPQHGTLSGTGANLTYMPNANYNGSDYFTFKVNDGQADSVVEEARIIIRPVNDAPVAADDTATVNEDDSVRIDVIANDEDIDGDELRVTEVTQGEHGTVTIDDDGTVTYAPNANFNGTDEFTYTIRDFEGGKVTKKGGNGGEDTATVTITITAVNDVPVADGQAITTNEDTAANITLTGSDIEGDALTYEIVNGPDHGTLSVDGANVTYTPELNYNGPDSFTFKDNDGSASSNTATVSITVKPVNDAPVAKDDIATVDEDNSVAIDVLVNDKDIDNLTLVVTEATDGENGTVTVNDDGTVTYTPNANFNGQDEFTYTISDGNGGQDTATVTITINPISDTPDAQDDAYDVNEDAILTVPAPGVLENDINYDADPIHAELATQPANGEVTLNEDGSFTYTPDEDFNGTDSFTYEATDGHLGQVATVTITVKPVNDAPLAFNDTATTDEDTPVTINVKADDTDVDGDTLNVTGVTQGAHGSVAINDDGTVTYAPAANYNGEDSFTYTISDGNGGQDTATVKITVKPINDAPVSDDQDVTTDEDTAKAITLNASDVEGDTLSYSIVSGPAHGTLSGSGANRTYTPTANYHGPDSFTFKAKDGTDSSNTATVSINIKSVNDAPEANAGADQAVTATGVTTAVTLNGTASSDIDGDTLTYAWTGAGISASGATPTVNLPLGVHIITLTVTDPAGATSTDTVHITVKLPGNTAGGKVTGSGTIAGKTGGSASFSLNPQVDKNGALKGSVSYTDGTTILASTQITALLVNASEARIFGKGTVGGVEVSFVVNVKDAGEPGKNDTFSIALSNGYTNGPKTLTGGNVQMHK